VVAKKSAPIAERFFAAILMPLSFYRNINMASGINGGAPGKFDSPLRALDQFYRKYTERL
jgi:hypothetical protein